MLVGVLSDSHDNMKNLTEAVKIFNEQNVALVVHGGDLIAPFVIPLFKKLNCKVIATFGNNDGDRELLKKRFNEEEGLVLRGNFAEIFLDGLKISLLHGNEEELFLDVLALFVAV